MPSGPVIITPNYTSATTAEDGLFVNMPKKNTYATSRMVNVPVGISSFKVYDDGGPDGIFSDFCDGYMILTAPENNIISSRFVLALILVILPKGVLLCQNNPYSIDDDCYRHFTAALSLVGRAGFDEQNDSLLTVAIAKNDDKAQVLHYILKLRSVSRDPDCNLERLTATQKELMDIALQKGYTGSWRDLDAGGKTFLPSAAHRIARSVSFPRHAGSS